MPRRSEDLEGRDTGRRPKDKKREHRRYFLRSPGRGHDRPFLAMV